MRTIRTKVYKFDELSKKAQEVAADWWRNTNDEIHWAEENRQSMEEFAKIFPIKVTDWCYGSRGEGVSFRFTCEDTIEELSGVRLATYIWNNYRSEIYKPKQYWICNGRHNCVGQNAKHRNSKVFLYDEFACPLTGYYMDNEILAPLYAFMKKPGNKDFKDVLEDCFDAWIKACNNEVEYQNSFEYIAEHLEANEYEFTKEGKRFNC